MGGVKWLRGSVSVGGCEDQGGLMGIEDLGVKLDKSNLIMGCHGEGVYQLFVLGGSQGNEVEAGSLAGKLILLRRSLHRSSSFDWKACFLTAQKKNRNVRLTRLGSVIRLNPFIQFLAHYISYDNKLNR